MGLNESTLKGLIKRYGPKSEVAALWLYLDLIVDFAIHVRGIAREQISPLLEKMKNKMKTKEELLQLIEEAQNLQKNYNIEFSFPQDPFEQMTRAIEAVALSWMKTCAQCAAIAVGLDPENPQNFPSVFVQQMKFTSLTDDSAFISILTHPEMDITYSPATVGRHVMFGLTRNVLAREDLEDRNKPLYEKVYELVMKMLKVEKHPLNVEIAAEKSEPFLIQISQAALSPTAYVEAVNKMVEQGIISETEAVRKREEIQTKQKVTIYKIRSEAKLQLLAAGKPGALGAMLGKIALNPEQALQMKKKKEKVILFSNMPQDENVYFLTLGGNLDGLVVNFGAGRGSHIVSFAEVNSIPVVTSLAMEIFEDKLKIGNYLLKAGDEIVIDGSSGKIFLPLTSDPIEEDKTIIKLSHGINYVELLRSMRNRYQTYDYEKIIALHAKEVKELEKNFPQEQIAGIQARIHCLHLLAYEKGKLLGKDRIQVDMDVAVADGNLNRIEGLEDLGFLIKENKSKEEIYIITGMEEYYDYWGGRESGITNLSELVSLAQAEGLRVNSYVSNQKLTMHTQYLSTYGIVFPREDFGKVIDFLKEFFTRKKDGLK